MRFGDVDFESLAPAALAAWMNEHVARLNGRTLDRAFDRDWSDADLEAFFAAASEELVARLAGPRAVIEPELVQERAWAEALRRSPATAVPALLALTDTAAAQGPVDALEAAWVEAADRLGHSDPDRLFRLMMLAPAAVRASAKWPPVAADVLRLMRDSHAPTPALDAAFAARLKAVRRERADHEFPVSSVDLWVSGREPVFAPSLARAIALLLDDPSESAFFALVSVPQRDASADAVQDRE